MTRRAAERGMTLLELLVAMAVFGLLLAAMLGLWRVTFAVAGRLSARADARAELGPGLDFLRRTLPDARAAMFRGASDDLTFIAPIDAGADGPGGLQRVQLAVDGHALRLSWAPLRAAPFAPGGSTVLLPGLSGLRLRYFGALGAGAPAWHDSWNGAPPLPGLVGLTGTRDADGGTEDLVVALRVTGAATSNQR